ncbi:MAG: serine hydrolase [Acidobacteria bacterium]|nr:serine hydrolase [Acidobacteriota bacterium]
MITRRELSMGLLARGAWARPSTNHWPGAQWEPRPPAALGLDEAKLEELATGLGGNGCVIKDGYLAKSWGDQSAKRDWLSSVKPVFSTLLFFAIQEKRLKSVDARLTDYGWALREKDRAMTFRHLADMTSGYARPEPPGAAYAYNDYAIQLYQLTLFDRLYRQAPDAVANTPERLGALQLEDGLTFNARRRLLASVRDFARIGWFWLNQGRWNGRQLLHRSFFRKHRKPDVPFALPHTQQAGNDDYLNIGTFGGGSDHFTKFGPGIYGFNWWFNRTSRLHAHALTWPDAPRDAFLSIGAGGNCCAIFPSHGMVLASSRGNWGALAGGDASAPMNRHLKLLAEAAGGKRG